MLEFMQQRDIRLPVSSCMPEDLPCLMSQMSLDLWKEGSSEPSFRTQMSAHAFRRTQACLVKSLFQPTRAA